MDAINKAITAIVATVLGVAIMATASGSILWLMWEHTVPYFFPMWIKVGLPAHPGWWQCVLLCWVTAILFKVKSKDSN